MVTMQPQGTSEVTIRTTPEKIWALLEDSTRLPEWAKLVKRPTRTTGKLEVLGAVRECDVEFDGKPGRVVERCVEYDRHRRIGWLMVEDSLGFSRMLSDLGFDFVLEPTGQGETRVLNTTYYRPKGLLAKLLSALVMRRKMRGIRERVLGNLKRLTEEPTSGDQVEKGNGETRTGSAPSSERRAGP